jgi:hypothetical protein
MLIDGRNSAHIVQRDSSPVHLPAARWHGMAPRAENCRRLRLHVTFYKTMHDSVQCLHLQQFYVYLFSRAKTEMEQDRSLLGLAFSSNEKRARLLERGKSRS